MHLQLQPLQNLSHGEGLEIFFSCRGKSKLKVFFLVINLWAGVGSLLAALVSLGLSVYCAGHRTRFSCRAVSMQRCSRKLS